MTKHSKPVDKDRVLRGIAVSPGIAIGRVYLIKKGEMETPALCHLDPSYLSKEIERFKDALERSKEQLLKIKERVIERKGGKEHAYIIDAHIMILEDRMLIDDTIKTIRNQRVNAEWAFKQVLKGFIDIFSNIDDEYFRERASDIEHVGARVLRNLTGEPHEGISNISEKVVVVAHDISPADTAQMSKENVVGFATDAGGRTSHTAIIARSLEIPAVVGLEEITEAVKPDDVVIVDGLNGKVVINPSRKVFKEYLKSQQRYIYFEKELLKLKGLPAVTKDGKKISLYGNIEMPYEVHSVIDHGGEGTGLYRTEFLYLNRDDLPSEEEHLATYREVIESVAPYPVTIRTLDAGADKLFSSGRHPDEINPALGLRAIRFCMKRKDIFKTQLRAILRAGVFGRARVMFPLVSGVEELRLIKGILNEAKEELKEEGIAYAEGMPVGIMIEVPSAAVIADILAKEVDFFSVGTNDLLQYSLAIDRLNEHVAYLYEPLHPSILRLIKGIVDAGRAAGIEVGICGEMAGEIETVMILLGFGFEQMSMNALSIPKVKGLIRNITFERAKGIAEQALTFSTAEEVRALLAEEMSMLEGICSLGLIDMDREVFS